MVMLDVDGVLTDGRIIYDERCVEHKAFDVHDGYGIERARRNGLKFAIITGRSSSIVSFRAKELNILDVHQGAKNKLRVYNKLRSKYTLSNDECCYMGDDDFDLPVLKVAGVSAAPSSAMNTVLGTVDIVTIKAGGGGAVRELLDMILRAKGSI